MQRVYWAMTEGLSATALLYSGRFIGNSKGGLQALQKMSICVGLPYTFLICVMTVSMLRALQYEVKERKWGDGFEKSVIDIGVRLYDAHPGKERTFNMKAGYFDVGMFSRVCMLGACPILALWPMSMKIEDKKPESEKTVTITKFLNGCAILSFYTWFILCWCDYAPVSTAPVQMGSVFGDNVTDSSINNIYYLSTRYGYFSGWNASAENNSIIQMTQEVNLKAGELPGTTVGPMQGRSMRIEAFGWYFFFCFALILTKFRTDARMVLRIPGSMLEDFCTSVLFWPTVLYQVEHQFLHGKEKPEKPQSQEPTAPLAGPEAQTYGNQQASIAGKI